MVEHSHGTIFYWSHLSWNELFATSWNHLMETCWNLNGLLLSAWMYPSGPSQKLNFWSATLEVVVKIIISPKAKKAAGESHKERLGYCCYMLKQNFDKWHFNLLSDATYNADHDDSTSKFSRCFDAYLCWKNCQWKIKKALLNLLGYPDSKYRNWLCPSWARKI